MDTVDLDAQADRDRLEALRRIVPPGGIVIDVGANRGQFATQLLSAVDCRIYALEPVPDAFDELSRVAREHEGLSAHQIAIADADGFAEFHVQASDVGSSLLKPLPEQSSQWLTPSTSITVPTRRLDSFFAEEGIDSVSLVKSDAQGFDGRVIRSAGDFLSPEFIGAILVETNFHTFYEDQDALHDVIELISGRGYFVAAMFPHYNREGWLWWADVLYLPKRPPYST